jgi:ectoine hydroxylase-related dioxygenase (phytanoyl-CoA dioxygenase family)
MLRRGHETRLENFVSTHSEWKNLCCNRIPNFLSAVLGEEMVLFKEKLNLKPPGGSGFAPHLDTPSLRVALGRDGPQTFVTVMVAIDDMTSLNGCLRVCKGPWTEHNHCEVVIPDEGNTNPDAEGRRGAIPSTVASEQMYEDIIIKGGTVALFNGWAPHRSVANMSPFPRRAVFLTYNPLQEGEFHDLYYQKMSSLRNEYKNRSLEKSESNPCHEIEQSELDALASIPR